MINFNFYNFLLRIIFINVQYYNSQFYYYAYN